VGACLILSSPVPPTVNSTANVVVTDVNGNAFATDPLLTPHEKIMVTATGFQAAESTIVGPAGTPWGPASLMADARGVLRASFNVPDGFEDGRHLLTIVGTQVPPPADTGGAQGNYIDIGVTNTVIFVFHTRAGATGATGATPGPAYGPGSLAATGSDVKPLLELAVWLITLGCTAIGLGWRYSRKLPVIPEIVHET
jgi:hypothetical protein